MTRTRVRVTVRLKPALLDPQGRAVEATLHRLGHVGVADLRVGKIIEFTFDGDPDAARDATSSMVERLLANPVMEDATIDVAIDDGEEPADLPPTGSEPPGSTTKRRE